MLYLNIIKIKTRYLNMKTFPCYRQKFIAFKYDKKIRFLFKYDKFSHVRDKVLLYLNIEYKKVYI